MSHGPIVEEHREMMNALADALNGIFNGGQKPPKIGFVLLTYYFGENLKGTGRINYISNSKRDDVLVALKELIARWEGRSPKPPAGKQ